MLQIKSFDANEKKNLYQEFGKKSSKSKKEEFNSNFSDNKEFSSNLLDNNNVRIFAKKKSSYFCTHLNRKNWLPIKQKGILFNTGAKTHIAKSINDFNTGTYTPATLSLINTANGQAKPFGFGKKTIICVTDINGKTHTLNLSKVQYLPNCGINIFGIKKFLDRGNI